MYQLQQPLIDRETALASGDRTKALSAAMPTISTLTAGYNAAKQQIMSSLPPGPGRDKALADLETQKYTGVASAQAQQVLSAPEMLANIASGLGAFSLQELGASLSGFSGASNSTAQGANIVNQQIQQQEAAKANQLGFIGGLASTAGSLVSPIKISDLREKENVEAFPGSVLKKILGIRVVTFDYKIGPKKQIGVIAQDVIRCFPEAVREERGRYRVDYGTLAAIALKASQELQERYDFLQMELRSALEIIGRMQDQIQALQSVSNVGHGEETNGRV